MNDPGQDCRLEPFTAQNRRNNHISVEIFFIETSFTVWNKEKQ